MNPAVERIEPSLIRAIHARRRPGDIDLGLGEPVLRPNPAPFQAAMRRVAELGTPYTPNAGLPELREAIAAHHALRGMEGGDAVCVTIGSEEAIYLAVKVLADPARDEVVVVEPGYLAYPKLCALEGIPVVAARLDADDGFAPRANAVLAALTPRTRVIVLNTPCNPTGRIWPERELRALAEGLASRSGPPVWVLVDEVYRELRYDGAEPTSIAAWHPHTVTVGSLSKSNALTGMRVGWLIAPPEVTAQAVKVHGLVATAAPTFSQWVALEIFRGHLLGEHRQLYAARRRSMLGFAAEAGLEVIPPEGAFYGLVRLPGGGDSLAAAGALLEAERVLTVPGVAFGAAGEGWLRISWVADEEVLREGFLRMGRQLGRQG